MIPDSHLDERVFTQRPRAPPPVPPHLNEHLGGGAQRSCRILVRLRGGGVGVAFSLDKWHRIAPLPRPSLVESPGRRSFPCQKTKGESMSCCPSQAQEGGNTTPIGPPHAFCKTEEAEGLPRRFFSELRDPTINIRWVKSEHKGREGGLLPCERHRRGGSQTPAASDCTQFSEDASTFEPLLFASNKGQGFVLALGYFLVWWGMGCM